MNHDIAHCNGEKCDRRDTCQRFRAHMEAVRLDLKHVGYLAAENCINNKIPYAWYKHG
jgi:hypothetical protein